MVKLTIDSKVIEVEEGSTILEAAEESGISIPTLCHHEALTPIGSCRLCSVEVIHNNKSSIITACNYPAEDGMTVSTKSVDVVNARKMVIELLLAQCPHSSKIQALARQLGVNQPRFTVKTQDCVLCQMCVKTCHEIVGIGAISFITKGADQEIDEVSIDILTDKCIGCDSCAYICPTDAITVEDIGDTRIINMPNVKMEFKLKRCKTCGNYWAPERQLDYIAQKSDLAPEIFDNCTNCRD